MLLYVIDMIARGMTAGAAMGMQQQRAEQPPKSSMGLLTKLSEILTIFLRPNTHVWGGILHELVRLCQGLWNAVSLI